MQIISKYCINNLIFLQYSNMVFNYFVCLNTHFSYAFEIHLKIIAA